MKFILLMNVKMPTIVGILTFISRINTSENSKTRKKNQHFSFYEKLKFYAQFSFYEELKFHAQFSFYEELKFHAQ